MAVRLTGSFYDINGAEYRVDIHDADFVGSSSSFGVKYCRINYDSDKNDDTNSPIIGSRAEVGMEVPVDDSTLVTFIDDFAEGAEDRFFLEVTKVLTSLVVWRGILTPDFAGDEDTAPVFVFNVSAVCGIATLKKKPYHDGSAIYTGIDRLTKHLTRALSKIIHTDVFWGSSDIFLKTSVDWWATSMSSGADDDALFQGGVDNATFYDYKTQGGVDDDVLSCYDVLWHILKSFNCRIYQNEGVWWVEQIPYRTASPYYTRHYEKDGDFIASTTNSGANVIDQTRTGAKLATMNYDFLPALEKVEVNYDVKIRRNFLNGQNLTSGADTINFDQNISSNGGDATCRIKGQISFGVKNISYSGGANDVLFLIPNFRLKIGSNYLKRSYSISNFTAQVDPPEWTATASDVVAIPHNIGTVPVVGSQVNGTISFEILAPALPSDGDDNQFLMEVQDMAKWNGSGVSNSEFQIFWSASNLFLEFYDDGTPVVSEDQVLYTANNPDVFSEVYQTTIRIGTATLPNSAGRVMRWNGSIWVLADLWGQGVATRDKYLGDLLALNILNARLTPLRRLNGSLLGDFRVHRLIQTSDGSKWMFANMQWDLGQNNLQGVWFQLDYGTAGVSATPIKKKVIPNGPTYPPTTDPTIPTGLTNTSSGFSINPAPTVLAPVAYNQLDGEIDEGDTVTSIPIKTASTGVEFLAGDGVTLVNPYTGEFQTFTISTAPGVGDTSLSLSSTAALYDFPEDSYLVVKQNAYSFRLPQGTAEGQILRWDNTAEEWEVYSGTTDGHVLTWDTTNGWQAEAGGGGFYQTLRDDGTDKTQRAAINFVDSTRISFALNDDAGSNETEVSADIVDGSVITVKLADSNVTTAKIADSNVTTAKIADLNVTTAKIADDAVTYAKIQNVANNNRILGRVSGAGGNVEELTAAQMQTLLGYIDGALTATRIPYASDANTLTDSANLQWLNGTQEIMIAGGASLDARYAHRATDNIAGDSKMIHGENNVSGTYEIRLVNTRNVLSTGHSKVTLQTGGASAGDPFVFFVVASASNDWSLGVDNSDSDKFKLTPKSTAPGSVANSGIIVTSAATALVGINLDGPAYPLDVNGRARSTQLLNTTANPTAGALQAGMGTGGSVDFLLGTNNGFFLTFTVGTAPTADSNLFKITLNTAFPGTYYPVFSQINKNAARDYNKIYLSAFDNTSLTLAVDGTLSASTQYSFNFSFFGR